MPCGLGPQSLPFGFCSIPCLGLLQLFQVYKEHAWETWAPECLDLQTEPGCTALRSNQLPAVCGMLQF